jgi:HlyD family secretion protein
MFIAGTLVLILLATGCGGGQETEPPPTIAADYVPLVSVTGKVLPETWATVSPQSGGKVTTLLIGEGDEVAEGDVLLRLDAIDAELAVERAEAALAAAQADLARLKAIPRAEDVASAKAQVDVAEAGLQKVLEGVSNQQLIAARAELKNAEAQLEQAQAAYDPVKWRPEVSLLPQSLQLEQATNAYEAAQARYQDLVQQPTAADIQRAEAQIAQAEAQLEQVKAGAMSAEIDAAEAAVQQAETALAEANVALERTEVRAPFAGTIGDVQIRSGEFVSPGQPLLTLGNLETLRVETTDLDEVDVTRIEVGQEATVTFDALPDQTFTGTIQSIAPMAEPGAGGVNYTVILTLDEIDPRIRWGMTAFVDIEPQ